MRTNDVTSQPDNRPACTTSSKGVTLIQVVPHRWLTATVAALSALLLLSPAFASAATKTSPRTSAKPAVKPSATKAATKKPAKATKNSKAKPATKPASPTTTKAIALPSTTIAAASVETPASTTVAIAPAAATVAPKTSTFKAEVWADNWFAMSVNGVKVGEDTVAITTEKSFNAETFTFTAAYPLTIAIEAKDFKQNDSGLEYIGKPNQQMGDGGLIAQITDVATGKVVAVTSASWQTLVIHRAPLNQSCVKDANPEKTCTFSSVAAPSQWTTSAFDDTPWKPATIWQAADVGPKDGYNTITWNPAAKFVWGSDLFIDNTVLLRLKISTAPI